MRELVIRARLDGLATTAGELLDALQAMAPAARRQLLDQARDAVGLESIEDLERARAPAGIRRVNVANGLQQCHHDGCSTIPTDEYGAWCRVNCRAWYCPEHRAGHDDDMRDLGFGLRYSENGVLVPDDPAADARAAAEAESRRRQQEARQADRRPEAEAHRQHQQALREQLAHELRPHLRSSSVPRTDRGPWVGRELGHRSELPRAEVVGVGARSDTSSAQAAQAGLRTRGGAHHQPCRHGSEQCKPLHVDSPPSPRPRASV
jgi:hypothetical protein